MSNLLGRLGLSWGAEVFLGSTWGRSRVSLHAIEIFWSTLAEHGAALFKLPPERKKIARIIFGLWAALLGSVGDNYLGTLLEFLGLSKTLSGPFGALLGLSRGSFWALVDSPGGSP